MILDQIFKDLSELKAGKGVWQNEFHQYDVYTHMVKCAEHIKEFTSDRDLIAAAYLHDIGKPVAAKPKYKDGVIQRHPSGAQYHKYKNHESIGEQMVREMDSDFFKKLDLNQDRVAHLVGYHYMPMTHIKVMRKMSTYEGFLKHYQQLDKLLDEAPVEKEDIMILFLADTLAKGGHIENKAELLTIRKALLGQEKNLRKVYEIQRAYVIAA
ncbi:HD domain-containing protein [Candidatus Woesearchaeota archaeon]|nr:HD domain-containing protein [Candidatus Woesearchaeota archaeon]MBW2994211.1 HD domain-containing protein [Candidatus Woesearchaeota archaeon]